MASRNTPLDAFRSGLQIENVTIAVPTPLSSLVTLPMGANLVWLQVLGGDLAYRLDGGLAPGGLVLTDGGYLPMNRAAMEQCVLTSGSGLTLVLQFFEGATGPGMPLPSKPGGSGPPPPPPGLTSLPTENVVWVMKNGDDATGQRNRMDLPFLTITAGVAAAKAGDTVVVLPGTYNEGSILVDKPIIINLWGARVVGSSGDDYVFWTGTNTPNAAGPSIVGNGTIRNANIASVFGNWRRVQVEEIANATGSAVVLGSNSVNTYLDGRFSSLGAVPTLESAANSMVHVVGDVINGGSGPAIGSGQFMVFGDVRNTGTGPAIYSNGGTFTVVVHGNVVTAAGRGIDYSGVVSGASATAVVVGRVESGSGNTIHMGTRTSGGGNSFCRVHGPVIGQARAIQMVDENCHVEVYGNVQGAGESTVLLNSNGGSLTIYGDVLSSATDQGVYAQQYGRLTIYGNVRTETANVALYSTSELPVIVRGVVENTVSDGVVAQGGTVVECDSIEAGTGARVKGSTLRVNGPITSTNDYAVSMVGGTVVCGKASSAVAAFYIEGADANVRCNDIQTYGYALTLVDEPTGVQCRVDGDINASSLVVGDAGAPSRIHVFGDVRTLSNITLGNDLDVRISGRWTSDGDIVTSPGTIRLDVSDGIVGPSIRLEHYGGILRLAGTVVLDGIDVYAGRLEYLSGDGEVFAVQFFGGISAVLGCRLSLDNPLFCGNGSDVTLLATARLVSAITESISTDTTVTVKSLGAWANVGEGSGVTIDGVLNVGAFVS